MIKDSRTVIERMTDRVNSWREDFLLWAGVGSSSTYIAWVREKTKKN
jgi:hypothetical protein